MNAPLPSTADNDRAAYTVEEFITRVVPMSRAAFYQEVRAGRIRIVKRGHRTYVPADEGRNFIALLATAPGAA
jgi:hypothetical protein